ncbi:MAG: prepilin-type N-terminal cleavage/methylation domain-containing protein [Erysipelothrix sp.]|nr:prepilin-type N-terminal cleavage/methylation domain-containing protein [Erysipelothrix sp.]
MRKGFTLLEMIVVIMIIALLMLVTIPNIQKVITIVQDKGCESQVKLVDAAILQYMVKTDEIPAAIDQLIEEGLLDQKQYKCQNNKQIYIDDGQAYAE